MSEKILNGKKIAIIIAFRDFRDVEYFIPREVFRLAQARVSTVSSQKGIAIGVDGGEAEINLTASELNVGDFDAIVFIGGPGMGKKLDDESFQKIAREAVSAGKVLGAICVAPALLAKAGLLSGKKATVWSSVMDKSAVKILKEGGAIYKEEQVVVEGNIVTANGPGSSRKFAQTLLGLLTGKPRDDK